MTRVLLFLMLASAAAAQQTPVSDLPTEDTDLNIKVQFANAQKTPGLPAPFTYDIHDVECQIQEVNGTAVADPSAAPCVPAATGCVNLSIARSTLKVYGKCVNPVNKCCVSNSDCTSNLGTPTCQKPNDQRPVQKQLTLNLANGPQPLPFVIYRVPFH